eukprot:m.1407497 g.1407497  ORF g.1407497 m.1407497 type:complete len:135 (-) comp25020_c0_seq1:2904-3308(-)
MLHAQLALPSKNASSQSVSETPSTRGYAAHINAMPVTRWKCRLRTSPTSTVGLTVTRVRQIPCTRSAIGLSYGGGGASQRYCTIPRGNTADNTQPIRTHVSLPHLQQMHVESHGPARDAFPPPPPTSPPPADWQ